MKIKCPNCGKRNDTDRDEFCTRCGCVLYSGASSSRTHSESSPQPRPGGNSDARPVPPPRSGVAVGLIVFIVVVVLLGLMLIIRIGFQEMLGASGSGASEIEAPWTQTPKHEQTAQGRLEQLRAEYEKNGGLTDPVLSQAVSMFFNKPADEISFDELGRIRGLRVTNELLNPFTDDWTIRNERILIGLSLVEPAQDAHSFNPGEVYASTYSWFQLEKDITDWISVGELQMFQGLKDLMIDGASYEPSEVMQLPDLERLTLGQAYEFADFSVFSRMPNLSELTLDGSIESLDGVEQLHLRKLGLYSTDISDFSALSALDGLEELELNYNEYLYNLDFLTGMDSLRALSIEDQEELDFSALHNMPQLEHLSVEDSEIKRMQFLSGMTGLKSFTSCDNNALLELPELSGCTMLEELTLDADELKSIPSLSDLPNLRVLNLLNADDLSALTGAVSLEEIGLYYCQGDYSVLGALPNVWSLSGTGYAIGNSGLTFLPSMTNLRALTLNRVELWRGTENIYALPNLVLLDLSGCTIGGDFRGIANLTNLHSLAMDEVKLVANVDVWSDGFFTSIDYDDLTVQDMMPFVGQLSNLTYLSAGGNELTDLSFVEGMASLTYLDVSDNYITDLSPLEGLEHLEVAFTQENPVA